MQLFNIAEVLPVILCQVDGVMGYLVVAPFNTQVKHESGAGEALLLYFAIGPAAPNGVRHHALHSLSEIRVDDYCVGSQGAAGSTHCGAPAAGKDHFLYWFVEQDLSAQILGDARHGLGDGAATTFGMKDAVLVLEEGENAEETGAGER